jgi:heat shock protein HspQ
MSEHQAGFDIGQVIHHKRFGYRGVIVDVDPTFQLTEEWYERMARSRPPKDEPWYHVLVHDSDHMTYVAERNLETDSSKKPVRHPMLDQFFSDFRDGAYTRSSHVS